jgi:hypothetical protein
MTEVRFPHRVHQPKPDLENEAGERWGQTMTISNRNGSQASQQQSDRPAPGTVTRGEYPRGFVGGTPVSVMVYVNLSLLRDEARARKLLPGVPSLPVNQADFRTTLKKLGFLTRDPRAKERKKPGLRRARRAPQWSKR